MQVYILHHLPLKLLEKLDMPSHLLRLVLQVQERTSQLDHISTDHILVAS